MARLFKFALLLTLCLILTSCLVSTAAGIVKTGAKVGYSVVKGTVNGVSWAVGKAKGKINEDRLDGKWKVVGVYVGSFEEFAKAEKRVNIYENSCGSQDEIFEFNTKRGVFKPIHCENEKEDWIQYDYKFGKNPQSSEKENYLKYHAKNYISVIDVSGKRLALQGNLDSTSPFSGMKVYLFEKTR